MKIGDLDGDGSVTLKDLALLARILLGYVKIKSLGQAIRADVDGNRTIDVNDLYILARYIYGLIKKLPAEDKLVARLPGIVLDRIPYRGRIYKLKKVSTKTEIISILEEYKRFGLDIKTIEEMLR